MSTATLDTTTVRRWKRYPEVRTLPLDWTLTVPAHWNLRRLKEVASVRPSNVDKKSVEGERGVRLCNYVDVYKNDKITGEMEFMDATATDAQIAQFSIRAGDVVITKDSETWDDIAVPAYVPETIEGLVCGYHLALIRPDARCLNGAYLARCFAAEGLADQFRVAANGITRYGLDTQSVKCAVFPVPPVAEQRAIAAFLDRETARIDALIGHKERLIALLEEKRQAVISHAVTRGLDPNAKLKDSGNDLIGFVPAHWLPIKLKYLFHFCKRQNHPGETVLSVFRDYGVIEKTTRDDNHNRTPEDITSYQLVEPGDLVINKMKAWQGSLGISDLRGITSPDYVVYRRTNHEHLPYLHHLLRSRQMAKLYHSISNGIRPDQWRIEPEQFEQIVLCLPPLEEQQRVAAFIERQLAEGGGLRNKIHDGIARLQEYRTALISAAVTGQIDVRDEVELPAKEEPT
jgi:type I restriction enzyme S subunit